MFADATIANGETTVWSLPNCPKHLDHILISNELFADFSNSEFEVEKIRVHDFMSGGLMEYDYYISDHRPVGMKVKVNTTNLIENFTPKINLFPSPTNGSSTIDLS